MANPTLTNYYGTTLAGLITSNAAAIGTDLGLSTANATDPDKLAAALLVRIREWLIADNTANPGISVENFDNGAYTKSPGTGDRAGQVGYSINLQLWVTDANPAAPSPASVV